MTTTPVLNTPPSGQQGIRSPFMPSASIPGQPWHVVYTKPQLERATEHRIRTEGHVAWCPMEAPKKSRRSDPDPLIRPLFPRYLLTQAYPWIVVRNAGGEEMATVLTSVTTRKPLALPLGVVETLMAQCAPNGVIYPPEPREVHRRDAIRVEDGPFTGFSGIVQRTTRDRVWVLLTLLGRPTEVPFTRAQVELLA